MVSLKYILFPMVLAFTLPSWSQTLRAIKDWKYIPVDEQLYQRISKNEMDARGNFLTLFEIQEKNKSSLTGAEAQALLAKTCLNLKWYFCAYHFSLEVISNFPGSMPSYLALETSRKLLENTNFYDSEIESIFSKGGFVEIPESSLGMTNFYLLRYNLRLGFTQWAKANKASMDAPDFWKEKFKFLAAIDQVRQMSLLEAKESLLEIASKTKDHPEFNSRVNHQIARLKFELKDFEGAEEIYSKLVPSRREYGRALIERAWIRYLKRDFAIALGMLHSLMAPSLAHSQHPDQFKLQMLILRDLCYFSEIKKVAENFRQKYEMTFAIIESGADLSESTELLNLVFQKAQWLPWAELISQIRTEKSEIQQQFSKEPKVISPLQSLYNRAENQLRTQVKTLLKEPLNTVARELLETREQVNLLEYLAGLDKIRPKDLRQKVKAEEIENFAIDKIYWPQTTEYWPSEINNIKVLISDRCQGE